MNDKGDTEKERAVSGVQKILASGETLNAFDALEKFLKESGRKKYLVDLDQLKSEYNALMIEARKRLITDEKRRVQENIIKNRLFTLLEALRRGETSKLPKREIYQIALKSFFNYGMLLLGLFVLQAYYKHAYYLNKVLYFSLGLVFCILIFQLWSGRVLSLKNRIGNIIVALSFFYLTLPLQPLDTSLKGRVQQSLILVSCILITFLMKKVSRMFLRKYYFDLFHYLVLLVFLFMLTPVFLIDVFPDWLAMIGLEDITEYTTFKETVSNSFSNILAKHKFYLYFFILILFPVYMVVTLTLNARKNTNG